MLWLAMEVKDSIIVVLASERVPFIRNWLLYYGIARQLDLVNLILLGRWKQTFKFICTFIGFCWLSENLPKWAVCCPRSKKWWCYSDCKKTTNWRGLVGDRKQMKNSYSDIENCKRMEVIDIIFIYASERKWLRKMTKRHVRPVLKLFKFYVCFSWNYMKKI